LKFQKNSFLTDTPISKKWLRGIASGGHCMERAPLRGARPSKYGLSARPQFISFLLGSTMPIERDWRSKKA
jgi:hypothetical protein